MAQARSYRDQEIPNHALKGGLEGFTAVRKHGESPEENSMERHPASAETSTESGPATASAASSDTPKLLSVVVSAPQDTAPAAPSVVPSQEVVQQEVVQAGERAESQSQQVAAPTRSRKPEVREPQVREPQAEKREERPAKRDVKPELAPDAPREEVPLSQFLEFDTESLGTVINAIRSRGKRPVVSFVIDIEGGYSRVDFGLAFMPGSRVQMSVIDGKGLFVTLFARQKFFRDEVFGEREVPEMRAQSTRGLKGFLEIVLSLRGSRV